MKVKIITPIYIQDLEVEINKWLEENQKIQVVDIKLVYSEGTEGYLGTAIAMIAYKYDVEPSVIPDKADPNLKYIVK